MYGRIYKGNTSNQQTKTVEYMTKYNEFIYMATTANIENITGKDLKTTADETSDSAAGLDQWAPGDLKHLSNKAYDKLAAMINMIEKERSGRNKCAMLGRPSWRKIRTARLTH